MCLCYTCMCLCYTCVSVSHMCVYDTHVCVTYTCWNGLAATLQVWNTVSIPSLHPASLIDRVSSTPCSQIKRAWFVINSNYAISAEMYSSILYIIRHSIKFLMQLTSFHSLSILYLKSMLSTLGVDHIIL